MAARSGLSPSLGKAQRFRSFCRSTLSGRWSRPHDEHVIVVEDQPDSRRIIRDMLAHTGYEIIEAEDGEQALAAIAKQRPDLILMDVQLPIMDGYTATRRIKADPALPIDTDHRGHFLCAQRRRADRAGGRL